MSGHQLYPARRSCARGGKHLDIDGVVDESAVLARRGGTAAGQILVAGGTNDFTWSVLKSTEIYLPGEGAWQHDVADMNVARMQAAAAPAPGGNALVVGGDSSGAISALDTGEVYNPLSNTWRFVKNTMSSPRGGFPTATVLRIPLVLVAGGQDTTGRSVNTADLYSPGTNSFIPAAHMGTARSAATATLLPNGNVLVAGGADANNNALASAEVYNPRANRWTPVSNAMFSPRVLAGAALLPGGKVLVAGGETVSGSSTTRTTDIYDPGSNSFTPGPSMTVPRSLFGTVTLSGGRIAVIGGLTINAVGQRTATSSVEIYDPTTSSWSSAAAMPVPSTGFTVSTSTLLNGQVLVAGGTQNLSTGSSSAELFTPPTAAPGRPRGLVGPPRIRLVGVPRTMSFTRLAGGLKFSVRANRRVSLRVSLLARADRVVLARRSVVATLRLRTVRVRPHRHLLARICPGTVSLVIVSNGAAGNRSTTTRRITVTGPSLPARSRCRKDRADALSGNLKQTDWR